MVAGTGMVSGRWVPTMVLGSSAMTTTAKGEGTQQDHHTDCHHKAFFRHNGHQCNSRVGNRSNFLRGHHTRVNEIGSSSGYDSECSVMSDLKKHLEEEVAPVTASPKN